MLERLKGTFDKSVAAVSVKSEALVESSRTKATISTEQKKMDAAINAIGVKLYQAWRNGDINMELFTDDLTAIQEIENSIAALNIRLEEIKQEESRILGGVTKTSGGCFCMNCGKMLPTGSRFCDNCGTPVNQANK